MSKLGKKEIYSYTLYGFTMAVFSAMSMNYTNIFLTDYLLYSASLMGTTLLVGRIVDLIVALMAGGIIEKSRLKWGKYRSWTMICRFTAFIGCTLLFTNISTLPTGLKVSATITAYILLHGSLAFLQTSQSGILSLMAGADIEARNILAARNAQAMALANIVASATIIPLINYFTPIFGAAGAYTAVAILLGLVFFLGATILSKAAKPHDTPHFKNAGLEMTTPTIKEMVMSVVNNDQLLIYLASLSLYFTAFVMNHGAMAYYFTYALGDFLLMSLALTVTTSFAVVSSIISPKIGAKIGKDKAMVVGLLIYSATFFGMTFLAKESLIVYIIFACLGMAGMYFFLGFGPNYAIDAGEYYYYKTGKDNRAIAINMYSIPIKIGFIVGGTLTGYALDAIGYTAGITPIPEFISKLMWVFSGIPAIFSLIGAIIMQAGYRITDEDAARYAKANAEKMIGEREQAQL